VIDNMTQLFELQAAICKTLSDPNRLRILHELREGELSVSEIVSRLGLPQGNVSHHLGLLRERGIVLTRREGTTIYYRLADERIAAACDLVRDVLQRSLTRGQELADTLEAIEKNSKRGS